MPKLNQIIIENYRSIKGPIVINFPENTPVVLIGENNTGKTNILRAIDLIFGEYHEDTYKSSYSSICWLTY